MIADLKDGTYTNGRGAQFNSANKFSKLNLSTENIEGIDDWELDKKEKTNFIFADAKTIVNKVESPDVSMIYSLNPYQGCEHGCIYCYARNSHEYWGFSSGTDFEQKIIVKKDAPLLFKNFLEKKSWQPLPISLSGNTDCYQPCERKYKLTRQILEIALAYKQPITLITKNALILRDNDILQDLAKLNLVSAAVSITSLNEDLRQKLEPRTTTAKQRLRVIEQLSTLGMPMYVMAAPLIPGLNDFELPAILKAAANAGAIGAGYTVVRLNGAIGHIFKDWLSKNFPDRFDKVWHQIQDCHHGNVNDSRFSERMRGTGKFADLISNTFKLHCKINKLNTERITLNTTLFKIPSAQTSLF